LSRSAAAAAWESSTADVTDKASLVLIEGIYYSKQKRGALQRGVK
jgi:hypothetical protein